MRAKSVAIVLSTIVACVIAGCGTSGSGTITVASGKGITIVCGGGGIQVTGGSISISGLTVSTSDGRTIKHIRIVLFIDRNGDGIPDATEILDKGELDSLIGELKWTCGTLQGSWGGNDPPPKIFIEVELTDGTKWTQTKGKEILPMKAPTELPEMSGYGEDVSR